MIRTVSAGRYAAADDFRVSAATAQDQHGMVLASLGAAGFIAIWSDSQTHAQRFDLNGNKIGAEMIIGPAGSVAPHGNGGFVVTYGVSAPYPDVVNVMGQIYDSAGAKVGAEFMVNTTTIGFQTGSIVTALAGGGFVVTWMHDDNSSSEQVHAQVFAADGSKVGGEIVANDSWQGDKAFPGVIGLAGGGFVISWYEVHGILGGSASSGSDSRAQVFDSAGNKLGAAFKLHPELNGSQEHPSMAALPGGGFVAAWSDDGELYPGGPATGNGNQGIWIQVFDASGAKVGAPVRNDPGAEWADLPTIAVTPTGFIVAWREGVLYDSGAERAYVQAQAFDFAGAKVGDMFRVDGQVPAHEINIDAIGLPNGAVVIGWTSRSPNSISDEDVRALMLFPTQHGTGGDDVLSGTPGREFFLGHGGSDWISAGGEADWIDGGSGNDTIDGGAGIDTAVVGSDAIFTPTGAGWTVSSSDGTDSLTGIEIVQGPTANTLLVGSGGFATIQAAVDSAADGDTILIAAGTYIEQVVVDDIDNLTIKAVAGALVTVQAPADLQETVRSSTGREIHAVVTVIGSRNVKLENIDVDGCGVGNTVDEGAGAAAANYYGIYYRNSSGGLVDVDVTATRDPYAAGTTAGGHPLLGGMRRGVGVGTDNDFFLSFGPLLPFTMTGGSISDFQSDAAIFRRSNLTVSGVTVTGSGAQTVLEQHGFQVISSTGTIADNVIAAIGFAGPTWYSGLIYATGTSSLLITGNHFTGANLENSAARAIGISLLDTSSRGSSITGNYFSHVDTAIYFSGYLNSPILIEKNVVTDSGEMDAFAPGLQLEADEYSGPQDIGGTDTADSITTGIGNDHLAGFGGDDTLRGLGGSDLLEGGGAADTLDGGEGNDTLQGDAGDDTLIGGAGLDSYSGGEGTDTVDFSGEAGPVGVNLHSSFYFTPGGRFATRTLGPGEALDSLGNYEALAGIENVILTAGDDRAQGSDGANRIDAGAGNDFLYPGAGNDVVLGGAGNDVVWDGAGDDGIDGEAGDDQLRGGAGNDTVNGGDGDDSLRGEDGDDQIYGGDGKDNMRGGRGVDSFDGGDGAAYSVNNYGDKVSFLEQSATQGAVADLRTGIISNDGFGNAETMVNIASLGAGTAFVDTFYGNDVNNALLGSIGDVLHGFGGDDLIDLDGATALADGGAGTDTLVLWLEGALLLPGEQGYADLMEAMAAGWTVDLAAGTLRDGYGNVGTVSGIENIAGTDLADDFRGTGADNVVTGGAGGDTLRLQDGGDDRAVGGAGNDWFLFGAALTGADVVDGGEGKDELTLQGDYSAGVTLGAVTGVEAMVLLPGNDVRFGAPGNQLYSYSITMTDLNVASGVQLSVDANRLRAGENLVFDGSAETDGSFYIFAGKGIDTLTGGAKNDAFLFRGPGNFTGVDTVNGGAGFDELALRGDYTGAHKVVFGATTISGIEAIVVVSGHDLRYGKSAGDYSFDLTMDEAGVQSGQVMIVDAGTLRSGERLVFDGSAETDGGRFTMFGGQGNDTLTGGSGADSIRGGLGADAMKGNGGADTFVYRNTADSANGAADHILDFLSGTDRIDLTRIDANSLAAGDQAFNWIGSNAFSGSGASSAGELRAYQDGASWFVEGDTNGDGTADLIIQVTGGALTQGDFLP